MSIPFVNCSLLIAVSMSNRTRENNNHGNQEGSEKGPRKESREEGRTKKEVTDALKGVGRGEDFVTLVLTRKEIDGYIHSKKKISDEAWEIAAEMVKNFAGSLVDEASARIHDEENDEG